MIAHTGPWWAALFFASAFVLGLAIVVCAELAVRWLARLDWTRLGLARWEG
jgi:hypothetical protein